MRLESLKKPSFESDLSLDSFVRRVRTSFRSIFEECAQARECEKPVKTTWFLQVFQRSPLVRASRPARAQTFRESSKIDPVRVQNRAKIAENRAKIAENRAKIARNPLSEPLARHLDRWRGLFDRLNALPEAILARSRRLGALPEAILACSRPPSARARSRLPARSRSRFG